MMMLTKHPDLIAVRIWWGWRVLALGIVFMVRHPGETGKLLVVCPFSDSVVCTMVIRGRKRSMAVLRFANLPGFFARPSVSQQHTCSSKNICIWRPPHAR
jgi:hypothetical protein